MEMEKKEYEDEGDKKERDIKKENGREIKEVRERKKEKKGKEREKRKTVIMEIQKVK